MKNCGKLKVFNKEKVLMEGNASLTSAIERRMDASRGSRSRGPVLSPGHRQLEDKQTCAQ